MPALEALEKRDLLATVTGLFNTGVDADSHLLAEGAADLHYLLVSSPSGGATRAFEGGYPLPPIGPYAADGPDSKWVSPDPDGTLNEPVGDYIYQTTFNLSGDLTGFALTGRWATDNGGVDIRVNGISAGLTTPSADFQLHDFSLSSGLVVGANSVEFLVHNDEGSGTNPTALRVEFDLADPVVPVPPVMAIPGLYNTGVDDSRQALGGGAIASHWSLVSSPDPSYPGPQTVALDDAWPIAPYGPWVANGPDVSWVGPHADGGGSALPGDYVYRTMLDLTGYDPAQITVRGTWATDNDGVDILVNGQGTGWQTPF